MITADEELPEESNPDESAVRQLLAVPGRIGVRLTQGSCCGLVPVRPVREKLQAVFVRRWIGLGGVPFMTKYDASSLALRARTWSLIGSVGEVTAGDEQATKAVVGEVAEASSGPPGGPDDAVDRLRGSVRGPVMPK